MKKEQSINESNQSTTQQVLSMNQTDLLRQCQSTSSNLSFFNKLATILAIFSILFLSFIQVLSIFQHSIIFILKSNVSFNNFSTLFLSFSQVYKFFNTVLFHSFLGRSNIFLQHLILTLFTFSIFYFDFGELSREPRSLHSPIRSLILRAITVWKHFNFLAHPHTCNLYVSCEIQKSPQHVFSTPGGTHLCETSLSGIYLC